jgi:Cu-Zn family superoxide dismutase
MLVALLIACATTSSSMVTPAPVEPEVAPVPLRTAVATLEARSGTGVSGMVTFREFSNPHAGHDGAPPTEVRVLIELRGAAPGDHAVHVHDKGDCSAADASSAGGHFNPEGRPHGDHVSTEKHPGDFGNVTVAADGTGRKELVVTSLTLADGPLSATGRGVIVHEKPDDFGQPTGNAGGRQACGVVTLQ